MGGAAAAEKAAKAAAAASAPRRSASAVVVVVVVAGVCGCVGVGEECPGLARRHQQGHERGTEHAGGEGPHKP